MLTSNKKILLFLLLFILIFIFFTNTKAYTIVPQSYEFYVNDTANVLDDTTKQYIIDINKKLYNLTGAQIVVVTINSLEGASIEEYSTQLFRSYGIGSKDKNNGVLFILSVNDRKTRIEVGYGLEGRITDGKAGRILDDYVLPYFKNDNWNKGIKDGFDAILKQVCDEYNISIEGADTPYDYDYEDTTSYVYYFSAFIAYVICLITRHIFSGKPLIKWIFPFILALVITFIDIKIILEDEFFKIYIINLIGGLLGNLGIAFLLSATFSGGGYSGGGFSGGSHGGGGSSGGGGASRSF